MGGVKKAKKKAKSPAKAIEKIPEVKAIKPGVVANIAKKTITDMLVRTEKVKHANRPKVAIPVHSYKGGAGKSKGGKKQSKKAKKAGKKAKKKVKKVAKKVTKKTKKTAKKATKKAKKKDCKGQAGKMKE